MADNRYDFSSLRFALTAGAAFPAALYNRIRTVLGIRIFDCWGMTECAPLTSYNPQVDKNGKPDSCGKPLPNCSVRIVDPMFNEVPLGEIGEVLLKSPAIMEGYYKNPKATDEAIVDGWVRSGDLGRLDAEGYLFIVGRRKDMIIRGGANIYSVDIEQVLYEHQAVAECAVIGVPDQVYSERVRAFVVLKDGVTGPS